ncbi:hypothetical protein FOA52_010549 [Chlamydomonas sp. UWO 241]|nr:hypothetical protein FOA52_010549 [Chlamydomonas sp. UWO 241]
MRAHSLVPLALVLLVVVSNASAQSPACLQSGATLQSACQTDIDTAVAANGGSGTLTEELKATVEAYVANPNATVVSASCCAAAKEFFEANRCGCDAGVVRLATTLLSGDTALYNDAANLIADYCGFTKYC